MDIDVESEEDMLVMSCHVLEAIIFRKKLDLNPN
jgi:hypothetical protein